MPNTDADPDEQEREREGEGEQEGEGEPARVVPKIAPHACTACRKSKVKCINTGSAPCRRCAHSGYECVFKPREPQESQQEWRARTEAQISHLTSVLEQFIQSATGAAHEQRPTKRLRPAAETDTDTDTDRELGRGPQPDQQPQLDANSLSPLSDDPLAAHNDDYQQQQQQHQHRAARLSFSSAGAYAEHGRIWSPRSLTHLSRSSEYSLSTSTSTSVAAPALEHLAHVSIASPSHLVSHGPSAVPCSAPATDHATLLPLDFPYGVIPGSRPLSRRTSMHVSSPRPPAPPAPLAAKRQAHTGIPLPFASDKVLVSRSTLLPNQLPPLDRPSPYRHPHPHLGKDDPRLDAIRMGIVPVNEARSLFVSYAKDVQPLGFGFPDFPASTEITPVLSSAILAVASLHSSSTESRQKHVALRHDIICRTAAYFPADYDDTFNPETGIGIEEVTGAAIFTSYDVSEEARMLARAARWWSEKLSYERDPGGGLTVGEMVAILPPLRHVAFRDRARIWLSAFVAECHQCVIHQKPPLVAHNSLSRNLSILFPLDASSPISRGERLRSESSASVVSREAVAAAAAAADLTYQDIRLAFFAETAHILVEHALDSVLSADRLHGRIRSLTRALLAAQSRAGSLQHQEKLIHFHYHLAVALVSSKAVWSADSLTKLDSVLLRDTSRRAALDALQRLPANLARLPAVQHYMLANAIGLLLQLVAEGQCEADPTLAAIRPLLHSYERDLRACDVVLQPGMHMPRERDNDHPLHITPLSTPSSSSPVTVKHPAHQLVSSLQELFDAVEAVL